MTRRRTEAASTGSVTGAMMVSTACSSSALRGSAGKGRSCVTVCRGVGRVPSAHRTDVTADWRNDAKFFGVLAMFGAIIVMALAPWLDTSLVRSGRYRPMFKWWFALLVIDFVVLMWVGAQPAEGIYPYIALIGATYWFAYFLVILPLVSRLETTLPLPNSISESVLHGEEAEAAPAGQTKPRRGSVATAG